MVYTKKNNCLLLKHWSLSENSKTIYNGHQQESKQGSGEYVAN
ncbi:hypothetical protein KSS87_010436 [Heliosperma pusillum]|nr:hypothetical protein KSS87_010436 [Heliosperma pusillum]